MPSEAAAASAPLPPSQQQPPQSDVFSLYRSRANAAVQVKKYEEAIALFEKSLKAAPAAGGREVVLCRAELGDVYTVLKRFNDAATCYKQALAAAEATYRVAGPADAAARHDYCEQINNVAYLAYTRGMACDKFSAPRVTHFKAARQHYETFLSVSDEAGKLDCYINLGSLLVNAGKYPDAVAVFKRALENHDATNSKVCARKSIVKRLESTQRRLEHQRHARAAVAIQMAFRRLLHTRYRRLCLLEVQRSGRGYTARLRAATGGAAAAHRVVETPSPDRLQSSVRPGSSGATPSPTASRASGGQQLQRRRSIGSIVSVDRRVSFQEETDALLIPQQPEGLRTASGGSADNLSSPAARAAALSTRDTQTAAVPAVVLVASSAASSVSPARPPLAAHTATTAVPLRRPVLSPQEVSLTTAREEAVAAAKPPPPAELKPSEVHVAAAAAAASSAAPLVAHEVHSASPVEVALPVTLGPVASHSATPLTLEAAAAVLLVASEEHTAAPLLLQEAGGTPHPPEPAVVLAESEVHVASALVAAAAASPATDGPVSVTLCAHEEHTAAPLEAPSSSPPPPPAASEPETASHPATPAVALQAAEVHSVAPLELLPPPPPAAEPVLLVASETATTAPAAAAQQQTSHQPPTPLPPPPHPTVELFPAEWQHALLPLPPPPPPPPPPPLQEGEVSVSIPREAAAAGGSGGDDAAAAAAAPCRVELVASESHVVRALTLALQAAADMELVAPEGEGEGAAAAQPHLMGRYLHSAAARQSLLPPPPVLYVEERTTATPRVEGPPVAAGTEMTPRRLEDEAAAASAAAASQQRDASTGGDALFPLLYAVEDHVAAVHAPPPPPPPPPAALEERAGPLLHRSVAVPPPVLAAWQAEVMATPLASPAAAVRPALEETAEEAPPMVREVGGDAGAAAAVAAAAAPAVTLAESGSVPAPLLREGSGEVELRVVEAAAVVVPAAAPPPPVASATGMLPSLPPLVGTAVAPVPMCRVPASREGVVLAGHEATLRTPLAVPPLARTGPPSPVGAAAASRADTSTQTTRRSTVFAAGGGALACAAVGRILITKGTQARQRLAMRKRLKPGSPLQLAGKAAPSPEPLSEGEVKGEGHPLSSPPPPQQLAALLAEESEARAEVALASWAACGDLLLRRAHEKESAAQHASSPLLPPSSSPSLAPVAAAAAAASPASTESHGTVTCGERATQVRRTWCYTGEKGGAAATPIPPYVGRVLVAKAALARARVALRRRRAAEHARRPPLPEPAAAAAALPPPRPQEKATTPAVALRDVEARALLVRERAARGDVCVGWWQAWCVMLLDSHDVLPRATRRPVAGAAGRGLRRYVPKPPSPLPLARADSWGTLKGCLTLKNQERMGHAVQDMLLIEAACRETMLDREQELRRRVGIRRCVEHNRHKMAAHAEQSMYDQHCAKKSKLLKHSGGGGAGGAVPHPRPLPAVRNGR